LAARIPVLLGLRGHLQSRPPRRSGATCWDGHHVFAREFHLYFRSCAHISGYPCGVCAMSNIHDCRAPGRPAYGVFSRESRSASHCEPGTAGAPRTHAWPGLRNHPVASASGDLQQVISRHSSIVPRVADEHEQLRRSERLFARIHTANRTLRCRDVRSPERWRRHKPRAACCNLAGTSSHRPLPPGNPSAGTLTAAQRPLTARNPRA
jgi:hypothetical protein